MLWIGLTGGMACGKSLVTQLLKRSGISVIDADEIAKAVVAPGTPGLELVTQAFGLDMIDAQGALDRQRLGKTVFADAAALRLLESLLHPLIRQRVQDERRVLETQNTRLAVYDVPLLFETDSVPDFDKVVVVTCTQDQQRERLVKKYGWNDEEINRRLAAQWPLNLKEQRADFLVYNTGDLLHLDKEFQGLLVWLKAL